MTIYYGGTWRTKMVGPSVVPLSDRTGWMYSVVITDSRMIAVWRSELKPMAEAQTLKATIFSHLPDGFFVRLDLYYCRFGYSPIMRRIKVFYTVVRKKIRSKGPTVYALTFEVSVPALIQAPSMRRARRFVRETIKASRRKFSGVKVRSGRLSPEVKTGPWTTETENFISGNYSYNTSVETLESYRRTWTGVRTPGFGSIKHGLLPVNAHTVTIALTFPGSNSFETSFKPTTGYPYADRQRYHSSMTHHYAFTATLGMESSVENRAIKKLIARADASMNANLAQDLAQFSQLTSLIESTGKRFGKSLRRLWKKDFSGAAKALWDPKRPEFGYWHPPSKKNSVAENWLELQYAWKPLLMDIQGVMDSISAYMANNREIQLVTASARMDKAESQPLMLWSYPNTRAGTSKIINQQNVKVGCRYTVDSRLKAFLAQTGFTNPLNLAWEILPFSFVADWALPIGPYLETLSAWHGLSFVDGFTVKFQRLTQTLAVGYGGKPAGTSALLESHVEGGSAQKTQISMVRSKLTAFPQSRFPSPKDPVSFLHASNALALLQTNFRDPRYRRSS